MRLVSCGGESASIDRPGLFVTAGGGVRTDWGWYWWWVAWRWQWVGVLHSGTVENEVATAVL